MYLPLMTHGEASAERKDKIKVFADLQTISISSTRSVSPVRVLGSANPVNYTRGASTIAGSLVFASLNQDAFNEVYDVSIAERVLSATTNLVSDQLPPFSIVITAANESGGAAVQAIHGITLVNYGTTYSVDDLYTEVVYSYVATSMTPFIRTSISEHRANTLAKLNSSSISFGATPIGKLIQDQMGKAYGDLETHYNNIRDKLRANSRDYL